MSLLVTQNEIDAYKPRVVCDAIAYYYTFINSMGTENQCFNYIEKNFSHLSVQRKGFNKTWQETLDKL